MKSEKDGILYEKRLHSERILISISIYMRSHLFRSYQVKDLSAFQREILANEIMNVFEDRFLQMRAESPPRGGD